MSLSERLSSTEPRRTKRGCETCIWLTGLPEVDQKALVDWLEAGWSIRQLHALCVTNTEHPLTISVTAFKNHIRDCMGLL